MLSGHQVRSPVPQLGRDKPHLGCPVRAGPGGGAPPSVQPIGAREVPTVPPEEAALAHSASVVLPPTPLPGAGRPGGA